MGAELSVGTGPSSIPGCVVTVDRSLAKREVSVGVPSSLPSGPVPPSLVSSLKREVSAPSFVMSAPPPLPPAPVAVPHFARSSGGAVGEVRKKKARGRGDDEYDDYGEHHDEEEEEEDEEGALAKMGASLFGAKKAKKDKPPVDPEGFRFRKYGKKMIGDEARHYYRCTFPGCDAKRHVTYSDDGPSVVLLGEHGHAPPNTSQRIRAKKVHKEPVREQSPVRRPQRSPAPPRMMGSFVAPVFEGIVKREPVAAPTLLSPAPPTMAPQSSMPNGPSSTAVLTDTRRFLEALEDFEERCEGDSEERTFVLGGRLDHCQDGQCWVSMNPPSNTVFACTVAQCTAHKRAYQSSQGVVVTYIGPHSHSRPQLIARTVVKDESSTSGSRGSLGDVYALLAGEFKDL